MAKTAHAEQSYKGVDEMVANDVGRNSVEMRGERSASEDEVNPELLANGIESLERKKKHWYSYLLTKDFWIVLVIG